MEIMQGLKRIDDRADDDRQGIFPVPGKSPNLLLGTKFNRPAPEDKNILRPRLMAYLDAAERKRLTLISAPAGFGKTTLAAQWLHRSGRLSAWLSLDSSDNDPERFLRYAVAAIRTVVPGFGDGIEPFISLSILPPPDYLADAMISELASLPEPLVLVLDDYHVITSSAVQQILSRMVEYLPDTLSLVVLTRRDPPWKLGRWRGRQWLRDLKVDTLAFTEEETHDLLRPYALTGENVRIIHKRTEGWVTALQLVALSLREADDPGQFVKRFSVSDRMIMDYLMDEVISPLPPGILDFLAVTAMLDRFCASLCNALLTDEPDGQDSRRLIAFLEKENLFLVPLDPERCWYRYHHLFQNLIHHHLKKNLSGESQTRLHLCAGKWFANEGLIEEALRHFLAAGEMDAAARLIEENLHASIDEDRSRKVLGCWLTMFPETELKKRPALLVAKAYQRVAYWDFPAVISLADRAEALLLKPSESFSKERRRCLHADVDVLRCFCLSWQGDAQGALRHALRALQGVPVTHHYAYTLVKTYAAGACASSGKLQSALEQLEQYYAEDALRGGKNAADILVARGANLVRAGELDAVFRTAQQLLTLQEENHPSLNYYYGYAYYFLAIVAYERNHPDAAADYLDHIRQMRFRVNTRLYFESLIGMAHVARAGGDESKVELYLSEARAFAVETQNANAFRIVNALEIRKSVLSGSLLQVLPLRIPVYERNMIWLENLPLYHAEFLVHSGPPADCATMLRIIEDELREAKKHHIQYRVIQFMALQAQALSRFGRHHEALCLLEKTLRMAQPSGMVRAFLDRGLHMADLMKSLFRKNPSDPYLNALLAAFDRENVKPGHDAVRDAERPASSGKDPDALSAPQVPLSNRETDVMVLLEDRLSSKEIAQRLFVSPETVRKHIANIFGKLHVHDRRRAVEAARKFQLLPLK